MAKSVRLNDIIRGVEQLALDPSEFWRELSFEELAERQGSGRPVDPDELYDDEATDAERDAFMAAIAEIQQVRPEDVPARPLAIDTDAFSFVFERRERAREFADLIAGRALAMSSRSSVS